MPSILKPKVPQHPAGTLVVCLMGVAGDAETILAGDIVSSDHPMVRQHPQYFGPQGATTQERHEARQRLFEAFEGRGLER